MKTTIFNLLRALWVFTIDTPDECMLDLDGDMLNFIFKLECQSLTIKSSILLEREADLEYFSPVKNSLTQLYPRDQSKPITFFVNDGELWNLINKLINFHSEDVESFSNYLMETECWDPDSIDAYAVEVWNTEVEIDLSDRNMELIFPSFYYYEINYAVEEALPKEDNYLDCELNLADIDSLNPHNWEHIAHLDNESWQRVINLCWLTANTLGDIVPLPDWRSTNQQRLSIAVVAGKVYFSALKGEVSFSIGIKNHTDIKQSYSGSIPLMAVIAAGVFNPTKNVNLWICPESNVLKIGNFQYHVCSPFEPRSPSARGTRNRRPSLGNFFSSLENLVVGEVCLDEKTRFIEQINPLYQEDIKILLASPLPWSGEVFAEGNQHGDSNGRCASQSVKDGSAPFGAVWGNPRQDAKHPKSLKGTMGHTPRARHQRSPLMFEQILTCDLKLDITTWENYLTCIGDEKTQLRLHQLSKDDFGFTLTTEDVFIFFTPLEDINHYTIPSNVEEKNFRLEYYYPNSYFFPWSLQNLKNLFQTQIDWTEMWINRYSCLLEEDTLLLIREDLEESKFQKNELSRINQERLDTLTAEADTTLGLADYVVGDELWFREMYEDLPSKYLERGPDEASFVDLEDLASQLGAISDEWKHGKRLIRSIVILK